MGLEQSDLNRMLEVATVAARLAGQRAMEEINYLKVSIKNNSELVTQTDLRCQTIIVDRIKENFPDHGFIAEEGDGGSVFKQPPRGAQPFWWAIDPIDGTNNYAHRVLSFAVSVALIYKDEPVVGVIFDPATESTFTAVKNGGAQYNGTRIFAGEEEINEYASVTIDSNIDQNSLPAVTALMLRTRFRNFGTTALHMAYVAKGGFIASILISPKLWDIAAGSLIVEEAGGIVTDWNGQKIFPMDVANYNRRPIPTVASNRKVNAEILKIINSQK